MGKRSGTVRRDPHRDQLISLDTRVPESMIMVERMPTGIRSLVLWSRERVHPFTTMIV
jgi:hypothetical protein